jgi:glutamyl-tRNA reductase
MHLVVLGISHKTAPLELRERLALSGAEAARLGRELVTCEGVDEAVVLSTCNRTEVYLLAADTRAAEKLALRALAVRGGVEPDPLRRAVSCVTGDEAIAHLFRVAASLDSLVVGEAQILAQLKDAYQAACGDGCTCAVFNRLFRQAIEVGKRVRTETAIGERPVSVSSVAVDLAREVLGSLAGSAVLVIGAGTTSELTVRQLRTEGADQVVVANRTATAAELLASRCGGLAAGLDELDDRLLAADIVISSTASPAFLVERERLAAIMARRPRRPMLLIDIAVPRDLDPGIASVPGCRLCDIDDLRGVIAANRHEREREIVQAERIVAEEVARMNEWLAGLQVVPTIARLRGAVDAIREAELERLGGRLADLTPEQRDEVERLTGAIVNKILHVPTVRLKELAADHDAAVYVDALQRLFDLDETAPAGARRELLVPLDGGAATARRAGEQDAALDGAAAPARGRESTGAWPGAPASAGAPEPAGERATRTAAGGRAPRR